MRYLVVGDVHGCVEELIELLERGLDTGRRLVFVGDLVAKGPDSKGVVALARERGALSVRGNHDQRVLEVEAGGRREHLDVRRSLSNEELAWLSALPAYLELPEVDAVVVHAGLVPGVALPEQRERDLLTMRTLRPDGTPSKRLDDGELWASRWPGPQLVVFGHDAVTGLQRWPHAIGLDTGCVYGGKLSAVRLPEREILQVDAKRAWNPPEPG